jgi:predicted RNA-binding Zn-ribbon protein involved in translation (DUF1610 family)
MYNEYYEYYDDEEKTYQDEYDAMVIKRIKTAKSHRCHGCGNTIAVGDRATYCVFHNYEFGREQRYFCEDCREFLARLKEYGEGYDYGEVKRDEMPEIVKRYKAELDEADEDAECDFPPEDLGYRDAYGRVILV